MTSAEFLRRGRSLCRFPADAEACPILQKAQEPFSTLDLAPAQELDSIFRRDRSATDRVRGGPRALPVRSPRTSQGGECRVLSPPSHPFPVKSDGTSVSHPP